MTSLVAGIAASAILLTGAVATAAAEVGGTDRYVATSILEADRVISSRHDRRAEAKQAKRDSKRRGSKPKRKPKKSSSAKAGKPEQPAQPPATVEGVPRATLEAIAACESGGDPSAVNPAGYYGKYQFSISTWQAVGGTGNPAAASEAEQDLRAAILYNRSGPGQWPVCGV